MGRKKRWSDLTAAQKITTVVSGLIQISLLAAALWDLRRRSPEELYGSKSLWRGLVFINFFGPIAYFLLGRKRIASEA
ncbi:MAG: PLDc N-terminal domain-containing protein [Anaerolineae bacterium]|nr:PLDc N-terminal domain-containing protein [Anaerolineae bacterium]